MKIRSKRKIKDTAEAGESSLKMKQVLVDVEALIAGANFLF